MKKISFKRIAIGVFIGGGFILGLFFCMAIWWGTSNEERCAEEVSSQPYISEEYYNLYFEDCLMRYSGEYENIIDESSTIVPPEIYVEEVG